MTDHCGSDLSGEKGSNSECILKLELARFVAGLSERDSDPGESNRNGGGWGEWGADWRFEDCRNPRNSALVTLSLRSLSGIQTGMFGSLPYLKLSTVLRMTTPTLQNPIS